jgi:hypothetical protein
VGYRSTLFGPLERANLNHWAAHNFKDSLLEKSKLAQHAYEEGHSISRDKARILEIGRNSR